MTDSAQILSFIQKQDDVRILPVSLENHCLEHEDIVQIYPINGKKRTLQLKRTQYHFLSTLSATEVLTNRVHLRGLAIDDKKELSINLINMKLKSGSYKKIYIAKSLYDFRLNGQWVREAILKVGDIIDFALNRLTFEKKENYHLKQNEEPISLPIAKSNLPILIEGETGTGKTYLAKKIHELSGVSGKFVHLNLSAFSEGLIESELFGHCKGAFTGANRDKRGAFVEANQGTLFLDEIDSMPKSLQTKLLLFLDDGKVRSVGANFSTQIKTRIIAASGSDLKLRIKNGHMRQDFYHRLASGVQISTKPLRENTQMIRIIIEEFSRKNSRVFCQEMIKLYERMPWPGNIRQLKGHLEKKRIARTNGLIRWDEYDEHLLLSKSLVSLKSDHSLMTFRELKKAYAKIVLSRCEHHYPSAAKILDISLNTLKKLD